MQKGTLEVERELVREVVAKELVRDVVAAEVKRLVVAPDVKREVVAPEVALEVVATDVVRLVVAPDVARDVVANDVVLPEVAKDVVREIVREAEELRQSVGNSMQNGMLELDDRRDVVTLVLLEVLVGTHLQHWPLQESAPQVPEHRRMELAGQVIGVWAQMFAAAS